jgi:phenylacetate-CoA ligase
VTDLHNRAMPFIRYSIGDIGVLASSEHDGDFHRKRIVSLQGRVNDTIVLPSGKRSPGLTFYYISRSILESSGVLREFIIRQTGLSDFIFEIVSDRALTAEEEAAIKAKMDLYLEPGLHLTIRRVPAIVRPPSGKIKHFYSELVA